MTKNASAAKANKVWTKPERIVSLTPYEEGKKLYKEACERCPDDPSLFVTILYMSGEIAESEALEFYLEQEGLTAEDDKLIM